MQGKGGIRWNMESRMVVGAFNLKDLSKSFTMQRINFRELGRRVFLGL